jgi:hypothetical protein
VRRRLGSGPFRHLGCLGLGLGLAHLHHTVLESVALGAHLGRGQRGEKGGGGGGEGEGGEGRGGGGGEGVGRERVAVRQGRGCGGCVVKLRRSMGHLVGDDDGHDNVFEVGEELKARTM